MAQQEPSLFCEILENEVRRVAEQALALAALADLVLTITEGRVVITLPPPK